MISFFGLKKPMRFNLIKSLGRASVLLTILPVFVTLMGSSFSANAAQVTLAWDAVADSNVSGYKAYLGTTSHTYASYANAAENTSCIFTGLAAGTTYYFAVTAYDASGTESAYSSEISYTAPTQSCTFTISPTSQSFSSSAGSGSVTVTTQSGCSWIASSGVSWLTITSGASGAGNGTVKYTVAANTSSSARSAGLTIASKIFTASQTGSTQSTSQTYTISATAGTGGTISPSGSVSVAAGGRKVFTIAASRYYKINYLVVDGIRVLARSSYTFSNVLAGHTIQAVFKHR